MRALALFQRALLLDSGDVMVVKIEEPDIWSGELSLTNDIKFMSAKRKERLKKILLSISDYVKEVYIINDKVKPSRYQSVFTKQL